MKCMPTKLTMATIAAAVLTGGLVTATLVRADQTARAAQPPQQAPQKMAATGNEAEINKYAQTLLTDVLEGYLGRPTT